MSVDLPAPPPRSAPLLLRLHAFFGGTVPLLGWAFTWGGLLVGGGLSLGADVQTPLALSQGATLQDTVIVDARETNFSKGGDEDTEGTPVYAFTFEYQVDGVTHVDTSYATGEVAGQGDPVTIEIAVSDPTRARIVGMAASPFGPWILLSLILPALAFLAALWGVGRGFRINHLLTHGHVTAGRLVDKQSTNATVNKRPVYAYVFEFRDDQDRKHRLALRTSLTWLVEDDVDEPVIFDPASPDQALMVDALPGHPGLVPDGSFTVEHPVRAVGSMVLPALTLCTLLGYAAAATLL